MTEFPNWFDITAKSNFEEFVPTDRKLRVLQIGTYTGDATVWLHENRDIEFMDDVDTWQGSNEDSHESIDFDEVYKYYMTRVKDYDRLRSWHMTSDSFFGREYGRTYNLIYVDGDHTASQTALDGINAFRLLESGGIIIFDDLTWQSGKGEFYDPRLGIEAFYHLHKDFLTVNATNSQFIVTRIWGK